VDFPVRHAQERLDYDYADIGGHQYLLPYRGELMMEGEEAFSKNLLDFLHYKKYSADSEITYDIPKDLSHSGIDSAGNARREGAGRLQGSEK
jgi:hypothetical protein